jgi:hypothetical protein
MRTAYHSSHFEIFSYRQQQQTFAAQLSGRLSAWMYATLIISGVCGFCGLMYQLFVKSLN